MRRIAFFFAMILMWVIAPAYARMPDALVYSDSINTPHTVHIWVYGKLGAVRMIEYHPFLDVPYMREAYPNWVKAIFKETKGGVTSIGVYPLEVILSKKPDVKWDTIFPIVFPILKTKFVLGAPSATESLEKK